MSPTDYLASGGGAGNMGGFVALLTPKIDRTQLEGVQVYLRGRRLGARQDLELDLERDHRGGQLVEDLRQDLTPSISARSTEGRWD